MKKSFLVLLLITAADTLKPAGDEHHVIERKGYVTIEQFCQLKDSFKATLKTLQTGLQSWLWTPQVAFSFTAKNMYGCSDRDIAIFPFAQGMGEVTEEEFMDFLLLDRINDRWEAIRALVRDVHDVRYQLHLVVCKELAITNTECGQAGYKQIENMIKADKDYEKKYKQHVSDGLVISHLYEVGLLQ